MIDQPQIESLLHSLAKKFEDRALTPESGRCAWGQFLDAPKKDDQFGPYGTSAGLLTLALAERGASAPVKGAVQQLQDWWSKRNQESSSREDIQYAQERIAQTLRLAFMYLALRLSGIPEAQGTCSEIERELRGRILQFGLWGDYWIDNESRDETPRHFTSAIVILALGLLKERSAHTDMRLRKAADLLESRFMSAPSVGPGTLGGAEATAVSAAILVGNGDSISHRTLIRMNRLGLAALQWHGERTTYNFNYEVPPGGDRRFGNGYFTVLPELLLAIGGLQPHAPAQLRLAAERAVDALKENIDQHGAFKVDEDQLLPSMDQAWAAILLALARRYNSKVRAPGRLRYHLFRERKENWFTSMALPGIAIAVVTAGNVLLTGTHPGISVLAALSAVFLGGLYAPSIVKRLVRGQR